MILSAPAAAAAVTLQAGTRKTHQLRYLSEEMLCRRWPIKSGILSVPHSD
jgi:hypothetical protein